MTSSRSANPAWPSVTVIIAARPGQTEVLAREASVRLDYPADCLAIIVARGSQPSAQRNAALRAAPGELVYFLDDDSIPRADNLRRAAAHFTDPKVQMVGGPNLCPPAAPALEQMFALTMGSALAFGPSRARYTAVGNVRQTSEKELILCNLMARKQSLLELGGFDEALYPNEENALMDGLQARGGALIYDPEFYVHRRPRRTLASFGKMLLTYGRGRAEQFRLHPTFGSAINFAPPMFCVYLLLLPWLPRYFAWPMAGYGLALAAQVLLLRKGLAGWGTIPFIFLTHLLYGLGFWRGLFTRLGAARGLSSRPITLEKPAPHPD
jgi:succinoglycan biosynthesis protein ExoA